MNQRFAIAVIFALGVAGGGTLARIGAPSLAMAQEASPAPAASASAMPMPMPAQSGMPMPMESGMPMMSPEECAAMQNAMQKNMKSPADMAMMQAMMTMHHTMMQTPLTGNADRDFLTMMIPHHQSAVDAAKVELRDGKDPKVRALAQRIVKAQEAEIRQMRAWLAKP